jgi:hypothetical protein
LAQDKEKNRNENNNKSNEAGGDPGGAPSNKNKNKNNSNIGVETTEEHSTSSSNDKSCSSFEEFDKDAFMAYMRTAWDLRDETYAASASHQGFYEMSRLFIETLEGEREGLAELDALLAEKSREIEASTKTVSACPADITAHLAKIDELRLRCEEVTRRSHGDQGGPNTATPSSK